LLNLRIGYDDDESSRTIESLQARCRQLLAQARPRLTRAVFGRHEPVGGLSRLLACLRGVGWGCGLRGLRLCLSLRRCLSLGCFPLCTLGLDPSLFRRSLLCSARFHRLFLHGRLLRLLLRFAIFGTSFYRYRASIFGDLRYLAHLRYHLLAERLAWKLPRL